MPSDEEVRLKHGIDEICTNFPVYGDWKIPQELRFEGGIINRKRVKRCMRETDIAGVCPSPNLTYGDCVTSIAAHILQSYPERIEYESSPPSINGDDSDPR